MRFVSTLLAGLMTSMAWSQGRVIVAWNPTHVAGEDLAYAFAREMDVEVTLAAVMWSLSDPVLRDAVNFDGLKVNLEKPSREEARRLGSTLKADFVVWIEALRDQEGLAGSIEIFRPGSSRAVWRKSGRSQVILEGAGPGPSAESLARTWIVELSAGVWKSFLKPKGVVVQPVAPGVEIAPNPQPTASPESEWLGQAAALFKEGKKNEAISLLYGAVDTFPSRLPVRLALLSTLREAGRAEESLRVARATLNLFPEAGSLRREVIQGLLSLGELELASTEINESLARFPDDPDFVILSGDWSLYSGRAERARAQYLRATTLRLDADTSWALATSLAWDGDPVELGTQLAALKEPSASAVERARLALKWNLQVLAEDLREAIRLRRIGNAEGAARAMRADKRVRGLGLLMTKLMPNENRLVLACNLLQQASGQVLSFTQTGDPDMGDEAQISLADSLRRFRDLGYPTR